MQRTLIFGASRGLGAALVQALHANNQRSIGFARKVDRLNALAAKCRTFTPRMGDLSKSADQISAIECAQSEEFARIFCVLGGGPFGPYHARTYASHEWAMAVTYVFPARLLHALAAQENPPSVILVGSSIAESNADPGAASYAAAKHALKGLWSSLRQEYPNWDLRLFSPGYLDTELLPAHAPPRQLGVYAVETVAKELLEWAQGPDIGGHRVYPKHPIC